MIRQVMSVRGNSEKAMLTLDCGHKAVVLIGIFEDHPDSFPPFIRMPDTYDCAFCDKEQDDLPT